MREGDDGGGFLDMDHFLIEEAHHTGLVLNGSTNKAWTVRIEQRLHLFDGSGAGKHHARLR